MRYRITDGVLEHLNKLIPGGKVVYVPDVTEAYQRYKQRVGEDKEGNPYLVAVVRRACNVKPTASRLNRTRGMYRDKLNESKLSGQGVSGLLLDIIYDITVLSSDNYINDTVTDQLLWRVIDYPTYEIKTGVMLDGVEEVAKSEIILDKDGIGSFEEATEVEELGRVYRTTFAITTQGMITRAKVNKAALEIPITFGVIDED